MQAIALLTTWYMILQALAASLITGCPTYLEFAHQKHIVINSPPVLFQQDALWKNKAIEQFSLLVIFSHPVQYLVYTYRGCLLPLSSFPPLTFPHWLQQIVFFPLNPLQAQPVKALHNHSQSLHCTLQTPNFKVTAALYFHQCWSGCASQLSNWTGGIFSVYNSSWSHQYNLTFFCGKIHTFSTMAKTAVDF